MAQEYSECSVCKKLYTYNTLAKDFQGFGKKTYVPKGWHNISEVKVLRFPLMKNICATCGGHETQIEYKKSIAQLAKEEWNKVDPYSELMKYKPKSYKK